MELRHLRYFIAVAEEGHITRAAERLGMQQPPLSQQIRALERELDVQLLRRKPRGVELTEAGRALLADARAILAHIDHAFATTRRTARGEQGRIAVGFTSSAPFHPFVPARHPRIPRQLPADRPDPGGKRHHRADRGSAPRTGRCGVHPHAGDRPDGPDGQPAAGGGDAGRAAQHASARRRQCSGGCARPLPLAALAAETFIVYRRRSGPGLYDAIFAACHAAGFSPLVGQEAPRIVSTLNLVAAGLGIAIVPASLQRMQMDGVVYRRLTGTQPRAPLLLATRRGDTSPVVRRFLDLVKRTARTLPADHAHRRIGGN